MSNPHNFTPEEIKAMFIVLYREKLDLEKLDRESYLSTHPIGKIITKKQKIKNLITDLQNISDSQISIYIEENSKILFNNIFGYYKCHYDINNIRNKLIINSNINENIEEGIPPV
ncbi:hypothetical protein N8569_00580 [bacterium]|nr:hypothetical protein [bacterium]